MAGLLAGRREAGVSLDMNPDRAIIGNDGLTWEQWVAALNEEIGRLALQRCYGKVESNAQGRDGWFCYFADGMSPFEAIEEDLTNL